MIRAALAKLLGRREILALMITTTFCAGFLLGKISSDDFGKAAFMILVFYFTSRQTAK